MNQPSVALSGVFALNPWVKDPASELTKIVAGGFKRVQFPVWYKAGPRPDQFGNYTLAEITDQAHMDGLAIDITFHVDGPSSSAEYLAFDMPSTYLQWIEQVLQNGVLGINDTVEWWNELTPRDGKWEELIPLYQGLGNQVHSLIKDLDIISVAPFPMSQTPQDVRTELMGMFSPQAALSPDRWAAHLYEEDLNTSDGPLSTIAGEMAVLNAAQTILEKPVDISEFGGSPSFYTQVASACRVSGRRACAWQWIGPGTNLEIHNNPQLISSVVGPTLIIK